VTDGIKTEEAQVQENWKELMLQKQEYEKLKNEFDETKDELNKVKQALDNAHEQAGQSPSTASYTYSNL